MRIVTYDRKSHFMTNSKTLVIPAQTKTMDDSSHILSGILGIILGLFWNNPKTRSGILLFLICAGISFESLAPAAVRALEFFSNYYPVMGFMNPQYNPAFVSLVYILATAGAFSLLWTCKWLLEITLPRWAKARLDAATTRDTTED